MYAGGMMARDLCGQLFADFYREQYHRATGSHTTKSSSPGLDDGFTETQYDPEKVSHHNNFPDHLQVNKARLHTVTILSKSRKR